MAGDEAEIQDLRSRRAGGVLDVHDRWGKSGLGQGELVREDERANRQTERRIAELETRRVLPALEQAAEDVERGQRLHSMAAFAGDKEVELELAAVLRRLAVAADPASQAGRRR